jgi:hypothetical protein
MKVRSLPLHGALLVLSVIAAVLVWTRDKQAKALSQGELVVWSGRSTDVSRVLYEGKTRKVTLEAKRDALGRYFVGVEEKDAPKPAGMADAGADAGSAPAAERITVTFVSVESGDKLAEALAPFVRFAASARSATIELPSSVLQSRRGPSRSPSMEPSTSS